MSDSKKKFNRSDITAFLAVVFSVGALIVSVIQARIMSEQQTVMVAQQKAAVWPYVELSNGLNLTDSLVYTVVAENKGVGPALVKDMQIDVKGTKYNSFDEFMAAMDSLLGEDKYSVTRFGVTSSKKTVYKPGEQKMLLEITIYDYPTYRDNVGYFGVSLNYCSIYNDCWKDGGEPLEPESD